MPGGFDGFVGIERALAGGRFAPAGDAVHLRLDEQDAAQIGLAEAGLKRREKPQMNFAKSDFSQAHFVPRAP